MQTTPWSRHRRPLLALASLGLLAAACSKPEMQTQVYQSGPVPRPERILVQNFTGQAGEVQLDSGLRGRLTQAFSGQSTPQQQSEAVRETSNAVTQALVEELQSTGIPVERLDGAAPARSGRVLLVQGQLVDVDEGNRTRRTMVGLGAGMSSVDVAAQVFLVDGNALPRPLESFTARADSGRMPGMAETLGVGAAAGRLATSAAAGGAGHAALEGSRADDVGEAKRLGKALAERIKQYFTQQGWAMAAR
jgi:hypothetical protein